jgi:hypothetical protein
MKMQTLPVFVSLLLILLADCTSPAIVAVTHANEHALASSGVSVSIDFGNGTNVTYSGIQAPTVLNATQAIAQLELNWYGDLAFVVSIDGVSNDAVQGLWWQYWVDQQLGPVAANKYLLKSNESIQWRRGPSQFSTNPGSQFNYSIVFGAAALGVFALAFLGVLYRRRSRGQ